MIGIQTEARNLDEVVGILANLPTKFGEARSRGLQSALTYLRGKTFDWIQSAGHGSWPKFHPLTQKFQKKGGRWQRRGRILSRANWNWLMRFVAVWQLASGFAGGLKFGKAQNRMIGTTEGRALQTERGHKTHVSYRMRRLMGATRSGHGLFRHEPGENFFPLRKNTGTLELKPHPIIAPIYIKERDMVLNVFEASFARGLKP